MREGAEGLGGPILVGKLRHEEGCTMHGEREGMETPVSHWDPERGKPVVTAFRENPNTED